MNKLIALFYFVLSLYGCDVGGSTFVHRSVGGTDVLYSSVPAQPGVARFVCLRSDSGQCHYTLFPRACASTPASASTSGIDRIARCPADQVQRFAVAEGRSRRIPELQRFRLCVGAADGEPGTDCEMPEPIATRGH